MKIRQAAMSSAFNVFGFLFFIPSPRSALPKKCHQSTGRANGTRKFASVLCATGSASAVFGQSSRAAWGGLRGRLKE